MTDEQNKPKTTPVDSPRFKKLLKEVFEEHKNSIRKLAEYDKQGSKEPKEIK